MARQNIPFVAIGNRGLLSPKSLARVDLDRTRLSAEVFTNFVGATQGSMSIRPGTKYFGGSRNDTGAEWIEFVASTDDVALLELTGDTGTGLGIMRVWLDTDAHNLSLLERPAVDTTVTLSDTGWSNTSTGGTVASGSSVDVIPVMTGATTGGVEITASSQVTNEGGTVKSVWQIGDDNNTTYWQDTGDGKASALPSWASVDFGVGNTQAVTSYSLRAPNDGTASANTPAAWRLIASQHDTGTYATDTGKWELTDERTSETGWANAERRSYTRPDADTGVTIPYRHWRLYVTGVPSGVIRLAEFELFTAGASQQVSLQGSSRIFNAGSIGTLARAEKRVVVSDTGTEHSLAINVSRGPITLRCGSSQQDDDYIGETALGTGYHNLAFTPQGDFWITLQSDGLVDRIVSSLTIGDSGTVEIATPWTASDLGNVRYDQSADVIYVDCNSIRPQKIERRGTGRSWSVVDYAPNDGPFLSAPSSSAKFSVSHYYGNTTLNSDIPFFTSNHVGALVRIFHEGQSGQWPLGTLDAKTDAIAVTGIGDTGSNGDNERRIVFSVSGSYAGSVTIERSRDGEELGFKRVDYLDTGVVTDTGTFTLTLNDPDDNATVNYRARLSAYDTGAAIVTATYAHGGVTGIARITEYNSKTDVDVEVLSRFSDTGESENWQQGYWSSARGFPSAISLHGGRLAHGQGGSVFLTVADDFESFDEAVEGDAGPIIRSLGSGPVDNIVYLISLLRLIIGTAGAEIAMKSSSLDEPLTPENNSASAFSTQGSANIRPIKLDTRAIHIQRSGTRVFMIGAGVQGNAFGDYESLELTLLVPDLLNAGVVSVAIQRQPDTRIHCVLADGAVAILTYEPSEEVICWTKWEGDTGTNAAVEKVAILPGLKEDAVYYHIRRTINGATKRYLEKWAKESETIGDTGLCFLSDCSVSYTDTGRTTLLDGVAPHLVGESVVAWGDLDTGSYPHVDLSPGFDGNQTRYTVDTGGDVSFSGLSEGVHHAVVGLPYPAIWKSSKLAYAAELGTALAHEKRMPQVGLVLYRTHNRGIRFGNDTGNLSPLPKIVEGKAVDPDQIFETLDKVPVPSPSTWSSDERLVIKAQSPRPCTVLALTPTVVTSEK